MTYRTLSPNQNRSHTLTAIIFAFCVVLTPLGAEEQNVNPGINTYYYDAEFERWVNVFESPGRELYDKRHAIVSALNLKPGMTVADVGAGTGLFTRLFAKQVGTSGRVYAVDISENFIRNILRTAREEGLNNVEGIVNTEKSTLLTPNSIDLAFLADTYHHFEYPQTMLASIHQALRPGGELIVIDFRKQPGVSSGWVMGHVRANEDTVSKEIKAAGFKSAGRSNLLHTNYFLRFEKIEP